MRGHFPNVWLSRTLSPYFPQELGGWLQDELVLLLREGAPGQHTLPHSHGHGRQLNRQVREG